MSELEKLKNELSALQKESAQVKEDNQALKKKNESLKLKIKELDEKLSIVQNDPVKVVTNEQMKQFKNKVLIARGAQSSVYRVSRDEFLTLREIEKNTKMSSNGEFLSQLQQEMEQLNKLNHPNIIKTIGVCFCDPNHLQTIVADYYPFNLLSIVSELQNKEKISAIYEIGSAMKEIHNLNIIHGNLKPENILIDENKHVKISDIGFALFDFPNKNEIGLQSLRFIAPELIHQESKNYNQKTDVYSFGVVIFFILTNGQYPKVAIDDVISNKKLEIPENIFNKISYELISRCLSENSEERPSFNEIIDFIENKKFCLIDGIENEVDQIKNFLSNQTKSCIL